MVAEFYRLEAVDGSRDRYADDPPPEVLEDAVAAFGVSTHCETKELTASVRCPARAHAFRIGGGDELTYPRPDRSNYRPNFVKTDENDQIDLACREGAFADGRPYRAELWAQDQLTCLTVFFSSAGLEQLTNAAACDLLEREGIVTYTPTAGLRSAYAVPFADAAGNALWSVNVVLVDEESVYADAPGPFLTYPKDARDRNGSGATAQPDELAGANLDGSRHLNHAQGDTTHDAFYPLEPTPTSDPGTPTEKVGPSETGAVPGFSRLREWLPVTSDQRVMGGALVFSGTHVPVEAMLSYLIGHGPNDGVNAFLADFPAVTREQAWLLVELVTLALKSGA
jgi:uncharacterized protein (DUF433 family)